MSAWLSRTRRRCPTSGGSASRSSSAVVRLTLARVRGDFNPSSRGGAAERVDARRVGGRCRARQRWPGGRADEPWHRRNVVFRIDEGERHLRARRRAGPAYRPSLRRGHVSLPPGGDRRAAFVIGSGRYAGRRWPSPRLKGGRVGRSIVSRWQRWASSTCTQGRFEEAQHWLDRAERAVRPDRARHRASRAAWREECCFLARDGSSKRWSRSATPPSIPGHAGHAARPDGPGPMVPGADPAEAG